MGTSISFHTSEQQIYTPIYTSDSTFIIGPVSLNTSPGRLARLNPPAIARDASDRHGNQAGYVTALSSVMTAVLNSPEIS